MNKKIILILGILALLFLSACNSADVKLTGNVAAEKTSSAQAVQEGPSCPRGLSHEEYPGSCGLYKDKDADGRCDYS